MNSTTDFTQLAALALEVNNAGPASAVPSPCVSVCRIDTASGWCDGCLRTLDEIAAWGRMDEAGKHRVWGLIGQRVAERTT